MLGAALHLVSAESDASNRERSRLRLRGGRKRKERPRSIRVKRIGKKEALAIQSEPEYWRPKTRGECAGVPRPCPYVGCRHHLFLDVSLNTGSIKLNFPDLEAWELGESCSLDVADRGGDTLERVGEIMNVTRERVRQLERLAKLEVAALAESLDNSAPLWLQPDVDALTIQVNREGSN